MRDGGAARLAAQGGEDDTVKPRTKRMGEFQSFSWKMSSDIDGGEQTRPGALSGLKMATGMYPMGTGHPYPHPPD